jgi:signal transduction histidine kinase
MFQADADAKGLRLRAMPSSLTAAVPPLDLMRMLSNLVANAIKATETGGVLVGVRRGGGLRVEVHDTGSGLPPAIFEAAQNTTARRPSQDGHGLGLSIVADLAAKNGLRFEHISSPRGGTVLRLWFP